MSFGILLRIIILECQCIQYLHYKMKLFLMPCISSQPQPHPNLPVKGVKIWYAHRKSAVTACYCLHVQCAVCSAAARHRTSWAGARDHAHVSRSCIRHQSVGQQHTTAELLNIRNNTTIQHHNNVLRSRDDCHGSHCLTSVLGQVTRAGTMDTWLLLVNN